jgi:hypothetical protein
VVINLLVHGEDRGAIVKYVALAPAKKGNIALYGLVGPYLPRARNKAFGFDVVHALLLLRSKMLPTNAGCVTPCVIYPRSAVLGL